MNESIGALWLNEAKDGKKYMSGVVTIDGTDHKIVVFRNNYKEEEKHPDYKIYPSKPRDGAPVNDKSDDSVPF
jgi:uncharacterized protein (DUF736 family)